VQLHVSRLFHVAYANKNVQILTSSYSSTSLLDKFTCFKTVIVVIIHSRPFVFWVLSIFVQSNIFYQGAQFLLWPSSISTSMVKWGPKTWHTWWPDLIKAIGGGQIRSLSGSGQGTSFYHVHSASLCKATYSTRERNSCCDQVLFLLLFFGGLFCGVHFRGDQLIFLLRICENPWNSTQW
jgi:hypothetical protein